MKTIVAWWNAESARIASVVVALAAAGLIPGPWGKAIGIAVPLLFGQAVRQTVYAPETVADKVEVAATAVAGQLDGVSAGAAGSITTAGRAVVDGVVAGVLGTA